MTDKQYPELPFPRSYIYEFADPVSGTPVWRSWSGMWNGQTPKRSQGLYNEEQMRAYVDADRAKRAAPAAPAIVAGDAVFAFASMLTALPHVVPFGSCAWATPGAELASAFNAANGLNVSRDFPAGLVSPKIEGVLLACIKEASQQYTIAASATQAAPALWFRSLVGAEAKPNGQCCDVVFVDPKDERYQPLYAAAIDTARANQERKS